MVALCDVNGHNLERAAQRHPKARKYSDFRKLYDESKDIDAVVVSTCEHTHAYATLPALQMGKPVYCEKPLTLNVAEARIVTRGGEEGRRGDANGNADPRQPQLSPRRRADPVGRDRPGQRGPRLGRPGLGPADARKDIATHGW